MTQGDRQQILAAVERLSAEAYRTLGQAYRPLGTASLAAVPGVRINAAGHVADIADQSDVLESDLMRVGMVGIIDRRVPKCAIPSPKRIVPASAPS